MNSRVDLWNPCLFVLLSLLFMQTEYEKNEVFLPLGYVNLANLIEHAKQFGHFILDNPISGLFNSFFPKNKNRMIINFYPKLRDTLFGVYH